MVRNSSLDKRKVKLILLIIILSVVVVSYLSVLVYNFFKVKEYSDYVLPNSYLQGYKIDDYSFNELSDEIEELSNEVMKETVVLVCNGKEYEYSLSELGFSLDGDKIVNNIINHQKSLNYNQKVSLLYNDSRKVYTYKFKCDENVLKSFLNDLKSQVDTALVNGYFEVSNDSVRYIQGTDSFSLDVSESLNVIVSSVNEDNLNNRFELVGTSEKAVNNDSYKLIDTKVSSFSTEFNPWISRATNLKTGLSYINGAIVEPGEVFSFYKYAGPYNKKGYVFYYEFVGNGVCQIATTTYNTALLGGLEIVKRYPHAKKSVYVPGGLDATVASYSSGWNVDFQFRNTYKYPIYISAYAVGGKAYVEFWSNSDAKEGKTYETESVQIGTRGYTTYLYTYQDGVQVDKSKIATTWYTED